MVNNGYDDGYADGFHDVELFWLVVSTPLKNDGVRQLGWLFPTEWKNKKCSKPPTRYGCFVLNSYDLQQNSWLMIICIIHYSMGYKHTVPINIYSSKHVNDIYPFTQSGGG